jgi:two-component system CheB/CheR fusion protein
MTVMEVRDEPRVMPNSIYVLPPDREMTIVNGSLQLRPRAKDGAPNRPIDEFFRSLAADHGQKAIGVILSGTGSDGTLGLEEIKAEGGITFA